MADARNERARMTAAAALAALLALVVVLIAPQPGTAAGDPAARAVKKRTEVLVRSTAHDAKSIRETYVRVHYPLPKSAPAHPKACDYIGYLRYRNPSGPRNPKNADAVIVAIPGFLGGAASFDQIARNVVRAAAKRGRDVEFWGLDRRANCLEDLRGLHAEARARDERVAFGYYFGDRRVKGKRFGGFVSREDAEFLKTFGLKRTLQDWYRVIQRLPRKVRARKLICGGHSLGGPLTAAFASWDFDGNPQTTRDAGFRQCAGLFGLDTGLDLNAFSPGTPGGGAVSGLVAQSGGSPYVDAPPLTPRTIQTLTIMGPVAHFRPNRESLVNRLIPDTPEFELTLRTLYSKDATSFASGEPNPREIRLTNAGVLGGVLDDNSAGISILRSSLGFIKGGPLTDKNFPAPDPTLALPEETNGPLYSWYGYRRTGRKGGPIALNDGGEPYTTRESEISSIRELARVLFEGPSNFVEQYFPLRLLTDVAAASPDDYPQLRYDGVSKRPALLIQAGDSDSNENPDAGPPQKGTPPNDKLLSREVILPGYNHLDVVTAARRQNDGRPEGSSHTLLNFTLAAVRAAKRR